MTSIYLHKRIPVRFDSFFSVFSFSHFLKVWRNISCVHLFPGLHDFVSHLPLYIQQISLRWLGVWRNMFRIINYNTLTSKKIMHTVTMTLYRLIKILRTNTLNTDTCYFVYCKLHGKIDDLLNGSLSSNGCVYCYPYFKWTFKLSQILSPKSLAEDE